MSKSLCISSPVGNSAGLLLIEQVNLRPLHGSIYEVKNAQVVNAKTPKPRDRFMFWTGLSRNSNKFVTLTNREETLTAQQARLKKMQQQRISSALRNNAKNNISSRESVEAGAG